MLSCQLASFKCQWHSANMALTLTVFYLPCQLHTCCIMQSSVAAVSDTAWYQLCAAHNQVTEPRARHATQQSPALRFSPPMTLSYETCSYPPLHPTLHPPCLLSLEHNSRGKQELILVARCSPAACHQRTQWPLPTQAAAVVAQQQRHTSAD